MRDPRTIFLAFREQCFWLQICFNMFSTLFEADSETEKALRAAAESFFSDLNEILREYCWLQAARITDPADAGSLTIEQMDKALRRAGLMTPEIERTSSAVTRYRDLIKPARNKIISHADMRAAFRGLPIGEHTAADVDDFLQSLHSYVDLVGEAVGEGPTDFWTLASAGDAQDLVATLRRAVRKDNAIDD